MAYEQRYVRIEESYGFYLNYKAPPVVSERHDMQFHYNSPMAPQKVIVNPADQYFNATKEEYQGGSWPKTNSYASLPPRVPQVVSMGKPITSDEAAKLYGGYVTTEFRDFRPKKQCHWP